MSGNWEVDVRASAGPVEAISSPMEVAAGQSAERPDPQWDVIDRWAAALAQGDVDEVDRLVRHSRFVRLEEATSGRLGAMVGQLDPAPQSVAVE